MNKILLIDDNHPLLKESLELLGFNCEADFNSSKEEIENKMNAYMGIVIRSRFKIDRRFIDASPHLKFIARIGAGLENIDRDYAKEKGIHLIAAPEGNRNAVGEHTLGMILSLMNNLNKADKEVRSGKWLREANRGVELDGKTVGIIGYGNMGKAFAKKLKGFDVKVICHDILPHLGDENCEQVTLQELKSQTDILSIHTDDNPLSKNMVCAAFIDSFHKPFYLINTARGSAVVTKDLVVALKSGKILGAALDVLEWEKTSFEMTFNSLEKQATSKQEQLNVELPTAFKYLIQSEKVLLTPHVAGWTIESKEKLARVIVEKIANLNLL